MTQPSVQAMLAGSFSSQSAANGPEKREQADGEKGGLGSAFQDERTPSASPSKNRSLSDSQAPKLSPSPKIVSKRASKDDATISTPRTPRRPDFIARGLSLQMPPRDPNLGLQTPTQFSRVPLSPQLDARDTYGTPATVLPRHSRGLDFARACTNLHHSTLAEQSSPDSSPTITQKGMMIPQRRSNITSFALDSPHNDHTRWPAMHHEKNSVVSSSLGSVNMLGSDSSDSSSDEDDPMDPDDNDDPMVMTPHVLKLDKNAGGPFGKPFDGTNGGYFAREAVMRKAGSRRESLSVVANDLTISSGNDSGDEAGMPAPTTPGVPKSRQFGRIRAELLEESAPVDSEVKREAEIIRQVRESDDLSTTGREGSITANSSPSLLPTVPGLNDLEDIPEAEDNGMDMELAATAAANGKGLFGAFNLQPWKSAERPSWSNQDGRHTPPPFLARGSSSAISDDINMDSPVASMAQYRHRMSTASDINKDDSLSRGSTPQPMVPPTAAEGLKKKRPLQRYRRCDRKPPSVSNPVRILICIHSVAIKSITGSDDVSSLGPAYQKYNEEQFATTKLPGGSEAVVISPYNSLGDGRYYDVGAASSFAFDHVTQKASDVQSHVLESPQAELVQSLLKALGAHAAEHYPAAALGVYPTEEDSKIAIVLVSNKYSPSNFWNGRWRSAYVVDPSSGAVSGSIKVDVHYYEDGNVRMLTEKPISASAGAGGGASDIVKALASAERKYQEDLNRAFASLSEGAFKGLRRQLPITRQKIEWEKISGYKLGQDIGGGSSRR
ncbi:putative wash complex f-actin capping protein alpha [Diplodia seriata]|uniref:F-actin-capping protein subunit alpha n=1 Tax=Diplodia seriata TaxID=420778 RepID=A0A0G2DVJ6_9PEZI|nr:putative wash complex f-actin capping protein alpha [Diplodia seriata]